MFFEQYSSFLCFHFQFHNLTGTMFTEFVDFFSNVGFYLTTTSQVQSRQLLQTSPIFNLLTCPSTTYLEAYLKNSQIFLTFKPLIFPITTSRVSYQLGVSLTHFLSHLSQVIRHCVALLSTALALLSILSPLS